METNLKKRLDELPTEDQELMRYKIREVLSSSSENQRSESPNRLMAYIEPNASFEMSTFQSYLEKRLPNFMIPNSIVLVEQMPHLPNGKIDSQALRDIQKNTTKQTDIQGAGNDLEKMLVEIWEEVMNFSPIGIHDNFFEIGGDSILSIQIIAKAKQNGLNISPAQFFEYQSISEIAHFLSNEEKADTTFKYLAPLRKEGRKKPLFCIHSGGGHAFLYNVLTKYLKKDRPIYAVQVSSLFEQNKIHPNIEEMTRDYLEEMRLIQPNGPYNVLVYCFSTAVGNEMALQLKEFDQKINIVVMDTMASPWNATAPAQLKVRIQYFIKRFFQNPLKAIRLFVAERRYMVEPFFINIFGSDQKKKVESIKHNLREICVAYRWPKHNGSVSLIITEKGDEKFQNLLINSWKELAGGGVTLYPTEGTHSTLFEEPEIRQVSKKIDDCLID
ncbi:MAG: phosphopantetheine-binding protein [Flavobacteriaceae bacterium]